LLYPEFERSLSRSLSYSFNRIGIKMDAVSVRCCIAGGGPAGMMLGLLLARAGIEVLVLEKHADFLRDFRGDTIHPSTLEVMHELGFLQALLELPHHKAHRFNGQFGDLAFTVADFSHLQTRCPFIVFMPQWNFLSFLAERAGRYPTFSLRMNVEVTGLIKQEGRIVGLQAATSDGPLDVHASLVVGADGRHSTVREHAGLRGIEYGAPMDVLWFRLPRCPADPEDPVGRFDTGRVFIMLNQGAHWQCGFVIPKGSHAQVRERGLASLRHTVVELAPFVADRVDELRDWEAVKLLTVQVDRLFQWYRPGLLCLGDAAHAMSPIGGVGINLAIQDAIAASNALAAPLRAARPTTSALRRIQRRRAWPTRMTQRLQLLLQKQIIGRALHGGDSLLPPFFFRMLARFPLLQRVPARLVGIGFRPEHVETPDIWAD
jgi:2-polyprenyl-6-methoxyphenol hydroxylase-like FAD-dependent oxidoreductase